jgi:DNA-binding GntR family transcriptional regulator
MAITSELQFIDATNEAPTTKREHAANAIRRAIHNGKYRPGDVISQKRLQEELDLSLTPLREAVIQLGAIGIIERHTHHSIRIPAIDRTQLTHTYEVRALLELEAIRLAVKNATKALVTELSSINDQLRSMLNTQQLEDVDRLDRRFHYVLFAASGNGPLVEAIAFTKRNFTSYALWNTPGRLETSIRDHDDIIAAVDARDLHTAVHLHGDHLRRGLEAALWQSAALSSG